MTLPPAEVERILDEARVARLGTRDAGGGVRIVPVVFARAEGRVWMPVDAKPKRQGELARVRDLRADPRATLLLDHYEEDWRRLWWVRVEGTAEVVSADPARHAELAAAVAALRAKYPQYAELPVLREPPTAIALRIDRVRSWSAVGTVFTS